MKGLSFNNLSSILSTAVLFFSLYAGERQAHLPQKGWYAADQEKLITNILEYDRKARGRYAAPGVSDVQAVIVSHAGHSYSGVYAAAGIRLLDSKKIKKIIVLAPCHSLLPLNTAVFVTDEASYTVPNGTLLLNQAAAKKLVATDTIVQYGKSLGVKNPFDFEHSMEIQLPFIKHYLPDAVVLPILVGSQLSTKEIRAVSQLIADYIDDQTALIVSSDWIHYGKDYSFYPFLNDQHAFEKICALTNTVMQPIFNQSLDECIQVFDATHANVCGRVPLQLFLALLEKNVFKKKLSAYLIAYATSVDDKVTFDSAVSYATVAFAPPLLNQSIPSLTNYERLSLKTYARSVLRWAVEGNCENVKSLIISPAFQKKCGTFVTLTDGNGKLRGCKGTTIEDKPLWRSLQDNIVQAALHDARFSPVTSKELPDLSMKCSLLSQPQPIELEALALGDGIIVTAVSKTALFLPEVAREHNWTKDQMIVELYKKAGIDVRVVKKSQVKFQTFKTIQL